MAGSDADGAGAMVGTLVGGMMGRGLVRELRFVAARANTLRSLYMSGYSGLLSAEIHLLIRASLSTLTLMKILLMS